MVLPCELLNVTETKAVSGVALDGRVEFDQGGSTWYHHREDSGSQR
jgi:hypothetical protein